MNDLASKLIAAREARGLTISQVAERTRLVPNIITAIESGDYRKIVAPIYGRGFVKLYCEAVGLESAGPCQRFTELYNAWKNGEEPSPAEETPVEPVSAPPQKPLPPSASLAKPEPTMRRYSTPSRYAAPIPIDEQENNSSAWPKLSQLPANTWRILTLIGGVVLIIILLGLSIRSLYRATMMPLPAAENAPVTEAPTAKANSTTRQPTAVKPIYID